MDRWANRCDPVRPVSRAAAGKGAIRALVVNVGIVLTIRVVRTRIGVYTRLIIAVIDCVSI